jgi:hypothetical protein
MKDVGKLNIQTITIHNWSNTAMANELSKTFVEEGTVIVCSIGTRSFKIKNVKGCVTIVCDVLAYNVLMAFDDFLKSLYHIGCNINLTIPVIAEILRSRSDVKEKRIRINKVKPDPDSKAEPEPESVLEDN